MNTDNILKNLFSWKKNYSTLYKEHIVTQNYSYFLKKINNFWNTLSLKSKETYFIITNEKIVEKLTEILINLQTLQSKNLDKYIYQQENNDFVYQIIDPKNLGTIGELNNLMDLLPDFLIIEKRSKDKVHNSLNIINSEKENQFALTLSIFEKGSKFIKVKPDKIDHLFKMICFLLFPYSENNQIIIKNEKYLEFTTYCLRQISNNEYHKKIESGLNLFRFFTNLLIGYCLIIFQNSILETFYLDELSKKQINTNQFICYKHLSERAILLSSKIKIIENDSDSDTSLFNEKTEMINEEIDNLILKTLCQKKNNGKNNYLKENQSKNILDILKKSILQTGPRTNIINSFNNQAFYRNNWGHHTQSFNLLHVLQTPSFNGNVVHSQPFIYNNNFNYQNWNQNTMKKEEIGNFKSFNSEKII